MLKLYWSRIHFRLLLGKQLYWNKFCAKLMVSLNWLQQWNTKWPRKESSKWGDPYLQPQIIFCLVRHLSVVIVDVAFPDQAVDGPLVGVGAVPQHPAVVKTELVLRGRAKAKDRSSFRRLKTKAAGNDLMQAGNWRKKRTACPGCSCTPETRSWSLPADVALCSPPAWLRSDRRSADSSRSPPTQGDPPLHRPDAPE